MRTLHPVYRCLDYAHIGNINPTVVIQIVHTARRIRIDDHVDGISVLVATLARTTTGITECEVVCRRAKARQDLHAPSGYPMHRQILQHQLYLVE